MEREEWILFGHTDIGIFFPPEELLLILKLQVFVVNLNIPNIIYLFVAYLLTVALRKLVLVFNIKDEDARRRERDGIYSLSSTFLGIIAYRPTTLLSLFLLLSLSLTTLVDWLQLWTFTPRKKLCSINIEYYDTKMTHNTD